MPNLKFKNYVVKKSSIGYGIYTNKNIARNQVLFKIKGKIVSPEYSLKMGPKFYNRNFRFGANTYLSPQGELGDYLNHSCDANTGIIKKNNQLYLISIKNIKAGSELFMDYSTTLATDDIWTMRCKCKSKNCRKFIKHIRTLPKDILNRYKRLGIIPKYILSL